MLINVFNLLLISVSAFGPCGCIPIGYAGISDETRWDVMVDPQTDDRKMAVGHQHQRFVNRKNTISKTIPQEDFVQIPDDMFITNRGMTEKVVHDSYSENTMKEHPKEKRLQSSEYNIDEVEDLESFNYTYKPTLLSFDMYDQQQKTVRVYLIFGYIFLICIVIFVCCLTRNKPERPCFH